MIVINEKIKKPTDVLKAADVELIRAGIKIDATAEAFNDGMEQGMVLKIFDKYNPDIDLCIWAYLPTERDVHNQMKILVGRQSNCKTNNLWDDSDLTEKIITNDRSYEMHKEARSFVMDVIREHLDKTHDLKTRI